MAKFKLTVEDKYIVVIFGEEGSKESFRVTINSTEPLEAIVKQYTFTLKQYLGKDSFAGPSMESKPMPMPVSKPDVRRGTAMVGNQMLQPEYPPKNLINSGNMQNPFGQEEYVGPNSSLFSKPEYQQPQGSLMIPPGARYDPVDPFDNPLMERRDEPNDFVMGFDEFGAPIKRPKPRGVMPPGNPFQGGFGGGPRGGFGGGLGGGFSGGFGGLV